VTQQNGRDQPRARPTQPPRSQSESWRRSAVECISKLPETVFPVLCLLCGDSRFGMVDDQRMMDAAEDCIHRGATMVKLGRRICINENQRVETAVVGRQSPAGTHRDSRSDVGWFVLCAKRECKTALRRSLGSPSCLRCRVAGSRLFLKFRCIDSSTSPQSLMTALH
jgi:hypothetical protein